MNEQISATCVELSERLSELVGYPIGADHIHHTEANGSGWYYYIQAVKAGHPLILSHYRGPLMVVLPYGDWKRLEDGGLEVSDYIDAARWFFGYFWGGGGLISGAYWQPLEDQPGIHDTQRISRYLRILSCRTFRHSSGYMPSKENCKNCPLDEASCPFSTLNKVGVWDNEVAEYDARVKLVEAISERVWIEYGLEVKGIMSHANDYHELVLTPNAYEQNTAQIQLSRDLLNDLLYHPEVNNGFEALAADLDIKFNPLPTRNSTGSDDDGILFTYNEPRRMTLVQRIAQLFTARRAHR